MNVIETDIKDLLIIEPKVFGDERGYFFESYNANTFSQKIQNVNFVQDNESMSGRGVLRGLHYQLPPYAQSKLVRVVEGEVYDVAVDIRKGSPTFGKHVGVLLSSENKRHLFIPRGFAHGFLVLSPKAVFSYKCDNFYAPQAERSIIFNDTQIGINWPMPESEFLLSPKDKSGVPFSKADYFDFKTNLYEQ